MGKHLKLMKFYDERVLKIHKQLQKNAKHRTTENNISKGNTKKPS